MADYTIDWIGWNNEGTSDKVWGYFHIDSQPNVFYTFWGKRTSSNGPKLTFKRPDLEQWVLRDTARNKEDKGYRRTSLDELERRAPFENGFELTFVGTRLCNTFHPNGRG